MFNYVFTTLRGYKKAYLKDDLLAGLVIAALTIPVAMGYAQVAGLPPIYGLYASILPVLGYSLLASSPQLVFGLDAASSAVTGSVLTTLGVAAASAAMGSHSVKTAIAVASTTALVAGIFLAIFALLRFDRFVNYISMPVMSGFIAGLGVSIIMGQIPKIMGVTAAGTNFFGNLSAIFRHVLSFNWIALVLGAATILLVLLGKRFLPKIPTALIVLILGTILTFVLRLDKHGVTIVGAIPQGFPQIGIPDIRLIDNLFAPIMGGLAVAIVVFSDGLMDGNTFAIRGKYKLDGRRELFAFASSEIFAAFSGCSATSSSMSRTAANAEYHGKTQLSPIFAGVIITVIITLATGLLYYMPQPVLSGIIVAALVPMISISDLRKLIERSRAATIIWAVAAVGVLLVGVLFGVLIGVILSFVDVIFKTTAPPQAFLGIVPGRNGYFDMKRHHHAIEIPGVVIYRFSSQLFFANIGEFVKGIEKAIEEKPEVIVVDASGITSVDITASGHLRDVIKELEDSKIKFYFAGEINSVNEQFVRLGLGSLVRGKHTKKTIDDALAAAGKLDEVHALEHPVKRRSRSKRAQK